MKYSKNSVIVFFTIVIILSISFETLYIVFGNQISILLLMWSPAFAAIVCGNIIKKENRDSGEKIKVGSLLGFRLSKIRYILLGIFIPFVYLIVPYIIYWNMHPENFAYSGVSAAVILKDLLPITVIGIFISLLSALGEEIGWRGFMLPALCERLGEVKTLFITGLIWSVWHLPLLAFGDYMEGCPAWFKLPAFVLCIVPVGIIAGYLTYRSKSIWPAAFLHAAHNNFDQAVFDVITGGDDKKYFVSETGVFTIVCAWMIAIVLIVLLRKNSGVTEEKA